MAAYQRSTRKRRTNFERSLFDLPEEILDAIFKRLPAKALFKFMSVSKRCKSVVSDPKFYRIYLKYAATSGFQVRGMLLHPIGYNYMCSPFRDNDLPPIPALTASRHRHPLLFYHYNKTSCRRAARILASNNGLILSQIRPLHIGTIDLCVSNPLTKQYVKDENSDKPLSTCVMFVKGA